MKTITQATWNKTPKDYKGTIGKQKYMLMLDKKTGATVSAPVRVVKK